MRRLLVVWLIGVLSAMVLGACGGGDDEGTDGAQEASATQDEGEVGADDGNGEDARSSDDNGDGANGSAGGVAGVFSATDCVEAVQAYSAAAASAAQAMSGDTKAMKASIAQMEEFADDAPREIRDELKTLGAAWSAYATAIADVGWDPAGGKLPTEDQTKQLDEAARIFEGADYAEAQSKLDDWFSSDCGRR